MRSAPALLTIPLAALAAAILSACSSGPSDPSERQVGSFEGRWDGLPWRGRSYAVLQRDTLFVVGHRPDPKVYYDEYIRARVPFSGTGTYPIEGRAGQLAKISGGDAGYFPDATGTLTIRSYDAQARTVAGEISLRAESVNPAWHAQGEFHTPVYSSFAEVPSAKPRSP